MGESKTPLIPSYLVHTSRSPRRYAIVEFRNADAANHALNEMNGHPFDTKHTFFVNRFTDIEKFADLDGTYVEPQREEYHAKVRLSIPRQLW
jgi:translation initiation factor 3 subunit B